MPMIAGLLALDNALRNERGYFAVADAVASSCKHGEGTPVRDFLTTFVSANRGTLHQLRKAVLGIGIHVAAQSSDEEQHRSLELTFGHLLDPRNSGTAESHRTALLCTELAYLDQFVGETTRLAIRERFGPMLESHQWSPAIRDYLEAWTMLDRGNRLDAVTGRPVEKKGRPRLVIVMSQKGGTGKTLLATSALQYFLSAGRTCAYVDLDASGPTAQYTFNISQVREGMAGVPRDAAYGGSQWCYPTFLDVLKVADRPEPSHAAKARDAAANVILDDCDSGALCVVLPDSPTFCAKVAARWDDDSGRVAIQAALDGCMDALLQRGCQNVVIDMGPGLYGTNAMVIRWASKYHATVPVVLTSPRASDIATSMYETPWLSAGYEFDWAAPLLHVVNRWHYPEDREPLDRVCTWAEDAIVQLVDASSTSAYDNVTSASQIHGWRYWPMLYVRSLSGRRELAPGDQVIKFLPEDSAIREVFSPSTEGATPFSADITALKNSDWYQKIVHPFFQQYLSCLIED